MERIFLIGYMGSGKTTLGKVLAKELKLSFVDLDWYIEERLHRSVQTLFAERGEESFRLLEQQMLREAAEFENVVISTGGGAPCFFDNMQFMNEMGTTIFLNVSIEVLFRRLKVAKYSRPLLKEKTDDELKAFISTALSQRLRYYSQAKYTMNADELESNKEIKQTIDKLLRLLHPYN
ncbi:MAG: shikimate kinase [Bacteroides sp.]